MSKLLNNLSPLPFYSTKAERDIWYSFGDKYKLLTPKTHILPFQLDRTHRAPVVPHSVRMESGEYHDDAPNAILLDDGSVEGAASAYSVYIYNLEEVGIPVGDVSVRVETSELVMRLGQWCFIKQMAPQLYLPAQSEFTRD